MDYNLERRDEISTMVQGEIQESKLADGFFSKNYANSYWCLEELVKMLESKKMNGQIVVPIFYDIDPSIAFAKPEKQLWGDMNRVQRWRSGCLVNSDTDLLEKMDLCDNFLGYEFMHHGSLENHLFGREGRPVLDWANLKIAAGNPETVHRDFKSSNILLDKKFEARLSDLGLVKLALDANVRPLSWYTRLKVMIGAARGLNFLHSLEKNIIYRDLKPSNILLDKASEPRKILQLENKPSLALLGIKRKQNIQTCMEQLRITNADLLDYGRIHCSLTSLALNRAIGDSTTDQLPLDCDCKKISQLQEKDFTTTVAHVRVKIKNRIEEPQGYGHNWRKYGQKETVQRVSSFVTTAIVFLMLIYHIFIHVEKEKEHDQVFPLLEPFGFMMFIWAIATMIVVGAPFSGLLTAMLFFWAILMLLISAKSLIALYLPISGIIFMGWHMLMEKQSPNEE